MMTRYKWLKDYHITSFGTCLDEMPAWFVDVITLIDNNVNEAMETKK